MTPGGPDNPNHASAGKQTERVISSWIKTAHAACRERGGGKSFNPIEVEDTQGYTLHQLFESPDDEAFTDSANISRTSSTTRVSKRSSVQHQSVNSLSYLTRTTGYCGTTLLSRFGDPRDTSSWISSTSMTKWEEEPSAPPTREGGWTVKRGKVPSTTRTCID